MKIEDFRYVIDTDPFNNDYPHWSRKWEYPLVISEIEKRKTQDNFLLMNTCCGFVEENHFQFINALNEKFPKAIIYNTDIKPHETKPMVFYLDITQPIPKNYEAVFDFVLCVSALEEIPGDHVKHINNLYSMVKPGGYLIITFDVASNSTQEGLQLANVEKYITERALVEIPNTIVGTGAPWFDGLKVGLLIIKKEETELLPEKEMLKTVPITFKYSGWELAPNCLVKIQELLIEKNPRRLNIIEFGSGKSTEVMTNFCEVNNLPGCYDVFDASTEFAHELATIKPLKSFKNDEYYEFYDLEESDFSTSMYDLVILDGHHGHGRSQAFEFLKNKLAPGCLMVIDDFDHYSFVEDFEKMFPNSVLKYRFWEQNNRWIIYEIL